MSFDDSLFLIIIIILFIYFIFFDDSPYGWKK